MVFSPEIFTPHVFHCLCRSPEDAKDMRSLKMDSKYWNCPGASGYKVRGKCCDHASPAPDLWELAGAMDG